MERLDFDRNKSCRKYRCFDHVDPIAIAYHLPVSSVHAISSAFDIITEEDEKWLAKGATILLDQFNNLDSTGQTLDFLLNQTRSTRAAKRFFCKVLGRPHITAPRVINVDKNSTYIGPEAPAGKENNWIQTVAGKAWFAILCLYGPLEPWFDKTWRPSEFEQI